MNIDKLSNAFSCPRFYYVRRLIIAEYFQYLFKMVKKKNQNFFIAALEHIGKWEKWSASQKDCVQFYYTINYKRLVQVFFNSLREYVPNIGCKSNLYKISIFNTIILMIPIFSEINWRRHHISASIFEK